MWSRSQAKATGIGPVFDYPHDPKDPDGKNKYVDSGIVHAFYIVNCVSIGSLQFRDEGTW